MENLKVKATEYKGILVFETLRPEEGQTEDFVPAGDGRIGCVLVDSTKLGVSPEAMELLKQVRRSGDDLGDPDVFKSGNKVVFGWLGGVFAIKHPDHCEGSSTYDANLLERVCQTIENEPPQGAKEAIDKALKKEA